MRSLREVCDLRVESVADQPAGTPGRARKIDLSPKLELVLSVQCEALGEEAPAQDPPSSPDL